MIIKILIYLLAFVCLVAGNVNNTQRLIDLGFDPTKYDANTLEDAFLTTPQSTEKYGYKTEIHTVTTSDDYILEMHRCQSRSPRSLARKAPVFLMHGLQGASDTWVTSPKYGLAYLLADMGYDVWMGNARGNIFSRKHKTLNPDGDKSERDKYWTFSWHEMGTKDLPTMIDKVLETTGSKKLHYIGVSQGTTCFWVLASELPEYNKKIISMHALAPVAFMSNMDNAMYKQIAPYAAVLDVLGSKILGIYELPANSDLILKSGLSECEKKTGKEKHDCVYNAHLSRMGYKTIDEINVKLPVAVNHIIGGSSVRCFVHYAQLIASGKFRQFDYGLLNIFNHGSFTVPEYKLDQITAPVALYYATADDLASVTDVNKLTQSLPNVFEKHLVKDPKFSHSGFILSPRVIELVFDQLFVNLQYAQNHFL